MIDHRRTRFVLAVLLVAFWGGVEVAGQKTESDSLERLKLQQERELKEKDLALRERELEMQRRQSDWNRWSNPAMVAVIGGLLGYFGTLLSSHENRKIERQK
jgi:hypothetical protein